METTDITRPSEPRVPEAEGADVGKGAGRESRQAPPSLEARSPDADLLRVMAMCAVVLLHAAAPAVARVSMDAPRWHLANALDSLARPAVPLFLMLTGALALRESTARDPWSFIRRRALPFWLPAALWMLAYTAWDAERDGKGWSLVVALRAMARGSVHYHLWYVWVAGGLLLALPILARWWTAAREGERRYALLAWGALSVVAPWVGRLWLGGATKLDPLVIGGWVGFPILGAWLAGHDWTPRTRRALQLVGVAGFLATMGGTAALRGATLARASRATPATSTRQAPPAASTSPAGATVDSAAAPAPAKRGARPPRFDDRMYGYLTPNVVVMAIAWWVTILPFGLAGRRSVASTRPRFRTLLTWVADASYPVYLAHPMILEGVARLGATGKAIAGDPRVAPLVATVAVLFALAVIAVGSRVPLVRLMVPVASRRRATDRG